MNCTCICLGVNGAHDEATAKRLGSGMAHADLNSLTRAPHCLIFSYRKILAIAKVCWTVPGAL
jgi:hypothetical protein